MATLGERLVEAQDAYHQLMTGRAAVRVRDADGSEIQYTQANKNSLSAYISLLESQIANASQSPCVAPMRLIF